MVKQTFARAWSYLNAPSLSSRSYARFRFLELGTELLLDHSSWPSIPMRSEVVMINGFGGMNMVEFARRYSIGWKIGEVAEVMSDLEAGRKIPVGGGVRFLIW